METIVLWAVLFITVCILSEIKFKDVFLQELFWKRFVMIMALALLFLIYLKI